MTGVSPTIPFRFGVMCAGRTLPRWQVDCLRALVDSGLARPALVISPAAARPAPARRGLVGRALSPRVAWNLYQRAFVRGRVPAEAPADPSSVLEGVPQIACTVERGKDGGQRFTVEDVARVRGANLDFILRFAFNVIRGDILSSAAWGVWSFHHDDLEVVRGMPACFWPMALGLDVQGVTLQRLTEGLDRGVVLERCWLRRHRWSYPRNRDTAMRAGSDLPLAACRRLAAGRTGRVMADPSPTTAPLRTVPRPGQVLRFAAASGWAAASGVVRSRVTDDHWAVGVLPADVASATATEPRWVTPLTPGRFFADPFAARVGGRALVATEELDRSIGRGVISAFWLEEDGAASDPQRVIVEPHHLSYPCLVERRGELFCVPESAEAGRVDAYAVGGGSGKWKHAATLLPGVPLLDPTVFRHGGLWWMLGCRRRGPEEARLEAYFAEDLMGPWRPHPLNPLKSDIRSARPAGAVFESEGGLFRPAQDCSRTYGGCVRLMRVDVLTPEDFEEREAACLSPAPGWKQRDGLHTLARLDGLTIVDAKRTYWRFP